LIRQTWIRRNKTSSGKRGIAFPPVAGIGMTLKNVLQRTVPFSRGKRRADETEGLQRPSWCRDMKGAGGKDIRISRSAEAAGEQGERRPIDERRILQVKKGTELRLHREDRKSREAAHSLAAHRGRQDKARRQRPKESYFFLSWTKPARQGQERETGAYEKRGSDTR